MKFRTLAGIACATTAFAGAASAETKCVLQQIGELPITADSGELTVEASIDGKPVRMIVDTGSVATSIFHSTAQTLGLRLKPIAGVTFYGAGGGDKLNEVGVKELKVGNLIARNMDLAVVGRRNLSNAGGLLGAGFLFQADLEIDVPDGKLRFFRSAGCVGDQVVYWGKAYAVTPNISPNPDLDIQISVKLGDAPIRAMLDSGASTTVVDTLAAERFSNHEIVMQAAGKTYGIGKELIDESVAVFPSFSFGDETIKNAKLRVAELFHADREVQLGSRIAKHVIDEPQMLLGADFFHSHRVYISKSQHKIYASYMGGPVFDTRPASAAHTTPAPAAAPSPPAP